nr:hypothetical protein [uncultured Butyrivibrio sp.]
MKWNDAAKLHSEDEVIVKESGLLMNVVEVRAYPSIHRVTVMLEDGNWYGPRRH